MNKNLRLKALALAVVVAAASILPAAGAQSTELSASLQASISGALQRIAHSPEDNELLIQAVLANSPSSIREQLVANGVDPAELSTVVIDAAGQAAGPRKRQAGTIYFDVGGDPNSPIGLVNMGVWVDWWSFEGWAFTRWY